jgi:hypothetical protein
VHTQGQFTRMQFRHELMKEKYPDSPNGKAIPLTGLSNARPETKAIQETVLRQMKLLPIELEDYLKIDNIKLKMNGDWGH